MLILMSHFCFVLRVLFQYIFEIAQMSLGSIYLIVVLALAIIPDVSVQTTQECNTTLSNTTASHKKLHLFLSRPPPPTALFLSFFIQTFFVAKSNTIFPHTHFVGTAGKNLKS